MEFRAITGIDELSELISASTFDEFYQKIAEENRKYDEEYYEAFRIRRLNQMRGLTRIAYRNWALSKYLLKLWHLARGVKNPKAKHPKQFYQDKPFSESYEKNKYQSIPDEDSDARPLFDTAKEIYNNIEQYKSTCKLLEDETSKAVLMALLTARLTGNIAPLSDLASGNPQYFDSDIIKAYSDEVVVDAGGYIGDTANALLETAAAKGNIKKIYLFEPNADNIERAKVNLSESEAEIIFRRAGVSDRCGSLYITGTESRGRLTADGQETDKVDIVALDEDIEEKITFIKMDIEGSEKAALRGCRRHILEDAPRLAICVYHKLDDVWRIPQYIKSLRPEYKFYLRHYKPLSVNEMVVYCLPCQAEAVDAK